MEVCSYFSHICTHMHAHTQLLIYTCTHASMYTCTHVALYRDRHTCTHTPSCEHTVCTHIFPTPPPSYSTPPFTQFVGVGDRTDHRAG